MTKTSRVRAVAGLVAMVAGVVLGGGVVWAPPATANPTYQVIDADNDPYSGIYLRAGTSMANVNRVASNYVIYGTSAELICGTWGEAVGPRANRRWHQVRLTGGSNAGRTGWVADRYMNTPNAANQGTPGEPECGAPAPAPTAAGGTYVSRAQAVRFCVNLAASGCNVLGPQLGAGAAASMVCYSDGSNFTGDYTTNRWFWVNSGSASGFVSASVVRNQTGVPACTANRAVTAASTAASRSGQVTASASDQALFAASEWKPGPVAEWAGDCPKLPYVAWRAAGVTIQKRDAITNYGYYNSRGLVRTGAAPVGAVVFFNVTSYGHEAVSLGNGLIATTVGMDGQAKPNTIKALSSVSAYLGWTMPG